MKRLANIVVRSQSGWFQSPLCVMPPFFNSLSTLRAVAVSTLFLVSSEVAYADLPPAPAIIRDYPNSAEAKQALESALQAMRRGDLSLATIQLKNALSGDPNNRALLMLEGIVLLRAGESVPAEHELRQARLNGAKDQDVVPPLLQAMLANSEWQDVLDQFPNPDLADKSSLAASKLSARALAYQFTGDAADALSSISRSLGIRRDVDGLLTRAKISMFQSNYADATGFVNQALVLVPNDPKILIMKAGVVSNRDKKAALAIIDGVLKSNPDATNAILPRIELLIELGRIDDAQQSVDAVLAKHPNIPFGVFYKAFLLGLHNKPLDGWRMAQSLPATFIQSNTRFALVAAQLAADSGHLEIANSILTTYVGQNPAIVESRLALVMLHLKMHLPNDALEDLNPLMGSNDPKILKSIASVYIALQRSSDALTYLRKMDAAGAADATAKYELALADIRQGNTASGVKEMLEGMKVQPGNLDAAATAIGMLLTHSHFAEAETLADQAINSNPSSASPPLLKGQILVAQNKLDDGMTYINQSLQRDPKNLQALDTRIVVFIAKRQFDEARRDLKLFQSLQPNNPLAYMRLAEIAALSNQPAQSIALMKEAISKDPRQISGRLTLAKYQVGLKQYANAQDTLTAALKIVPNDSEALALMGEVQQQQGQKAAAIVTDKVLVQSNKQSSAAQFLLANALSQNGDYQEAAIALKRAVQLSPEIIQYRTSLVDLQIQSGDSEGALQSARDYAAIQKGPDAALLLARTLARLRRIPEAVSVIAASQQRQPDFRLTILDSQIAFAARDRRRGISILRTWLANHADDTTVRQAYADDLLATNKYSDALAQYELVLKSKTDDPLVLNDVAWLLRDSDPNRAFTLSSKAMQLQSESPYISDTMGFLLMNQGNPRAALPVLEKAHALAPTSGEISYHLALVLNSLGRKVEAEQIVKTALANDQTFADAPEAKRFLQKL